MRIALALLACSIAFAQEFDVASVKVAAPLPANGQILLGGVRGGPGSTDPTHINWPNVALFQVLQTAYDVKNYQVEGPDWLRTERYDFGVVVPEEATKEQVAVMWRNLLASRFGMTLHKTQKEFPVEELQIGPKGHKLQENNEPVPEPGTTPGFPLRPGADGKINLPAPAMVMMMRSSPTGIVAQAVGRAQPISALTTMLGNQAGHPVVDKTGLTGHYDFSIEFAPSEMPRALLNGLPPGGAPAVPSQSAGPAPVAAELGIDIAGALQQQLGLKLVKSKGMLDVIVVDKAEKVPTDN